MPQQADAAPRSRPGACGGASFPPLITAQSPRGNGRAQNAHRLLRQPAYYYRPADCADYFGDMAKAAGEAALYTMQVCGGASLASIQADNGAACAAYIESRAADVGALGANVEIKLYNPAPFAVTVSTLLVTVTESSGAVAATHPSTWDGATTNLSLVQDGMLTWSTTPPAPAPVSIAPLPAPAVAFAVAPLAASPFAYGRVSGRAHHMVPQQTANE